MLTEIDDKQTRSRVDELLSADHAALDVTYRRIIGTLRGGDPDAIRAGFQLLERQLEAHFRAEEQFMLGHFERDYPIEAGQVRSEHRQIRCSLMQLGIDLDLHSFRADTGAAFIDSLRAHAHREENLFYHWAHQHLPASNRHLVVENLRAVLDGPSGDV